VTRRATREADRAAWPHLRLPVRASVRVAIVSAVALAVLTEQVAATALGALLASLLWLLVAVIEQTCRRPAKSTTRALRRPERPSRVVASASTAWGTSRAPRTPAYGIPVAPSIDGARPLVPRQRLYR
jgi:hypothetical protein